MTNPGDDAGQTASSGSGDGASEPTSTSYEAPPIEQTSDQAGQTHDQPTQVYEQRPFEQPAPPFEQSGYTPPPAYDPTAYQSSPPYQSAPDQSGFPPSPDYSGFPPPAQSGYPPPVYPDAGGFGTPPYPPPPPYGAPPPGFGPPPAGYPAPAYGAYGPPAQKTNGMAIGSLVASAVGIVPFFCGIGSIVGIILGFVALNQIKQSGDSGRGLAIAGIAVGCVTFFLTFIFIVAAIATES
jgi:hypothetical protein